MISGLPAGVIVTDPPFNIGYHYNEYKDNLSHEDYSNLLNLFNGHKSVFIHYPEQIAALAILRQKAPDKMVAWVYPSNTAKQHRAVGWWGIKPDFTRAGQPYKNPTDKRVMLRIAAGKMARLYDWWQVNQVKNVSKDKTAHPCQMPLQVMDNIIKITPAEVVIDPFMGSGTTGLACINNGVKFIGIERDEKYFNIAAERLARAYQAKAA